jgi:hypothetical protein
VLGGHPARLRSVGGWTADLGFGVASARPDETLDLEELWLALEAGPGDGLDGGSIRSVPNRRNVSGDSQMS